MACFRNYFIGWSQADLETELRKAQVDVSKGSTFQGGQARDTNINRHVQATAEDRVDRLYFALNALDPVTYPTNLTRPTRVTKAIFADFWP